MERLRKGDLRKLLIGTFEISEAHFPIVKLQSGQRVLQAMAMEPSNQVRFREGLVSTWKTTSW